MVTTDNISTDDLNEAALQVIREKQGFIVDMDGVLYDGNSAIEGAKEFIRWLQVSGKKYLLLTNSSNYLPQELSQKLWRVMGLEVPVDHFYTSALSTARFIRTQKPGAVVYAIGDPGLMNALYLEGLSISENNADYVVVGETESYQYQMISKAINLVRNGAGLIGTNEDLYDKAHYVSHKDHPNKSVMPIVPGTAALLAPISLVTGRKPFYCGKPGPLIMRSALEKLGVPRESSVIIGDRLDTDIIAGVHAEIDTVLMLTGVTTSLADMQPFAFRPKYALSSLLPLVNLIPTS